METAEKNMNDRRLLRYFFLASFALIFCDRAVIVQTSSTVNYIQERCRVLLASLPRHWYLLVNGSSYLPCSSSSWSLDHQSFTDSARKLVKVGERAVSAFLSNIRTAESNSVICLYWTRSRFSQDFVCSPSFCDAIRYTNSAYHQSEPVSFRRIQFVLNKSFHVVKGNCRL